MSMSSDELFAKLINVLGELEFSARDRVENTFFMALTRAEKAEAEVERLQAQLAEVTAMATAWRPMTDLPDTEGDIEVIVPATAVRLPAPLDNTLSGQPMRIYVSNETLLAWRPKAAGGEE